MKAIRARSSTINRGSPARLARRRCSPHSRMEDPEEVPFHLAAHHICAAQGIRPVGNIWRASVVSKVTRHNTLNLSQKARRSQ